MSECPGHHVTYGHGDTRTVHCPQCPSHECRESGCCPAHGGDRLTERERVLVLNVQREQAQQYEPTRRQVRGLLAILDRLAPRHE